MPDRVTIRARIRALSDEELAKEMYSSRPINPNYQEHKDTLEALLDEAERRHVNLLDVFEMAIAEKERQKKP